MITKKIVSITIIFAIAAMFFSSSAFVNPLLAKTVDKSDADSKDKTKDDNTDDTTSSRLTIESTSDKTKDDNTDDTKSSSSTSSSSAERNFKEFQNCLSDAEGTKGFATNQEIKDCYNPIYRTLSTVSPASTTTNDRTVKPIDFSTPVDFTKDNNNK